MQESTKPLAAGGTPSSGRLLQLLEEVRRLREQLHQGVRNSDALAEQLRSKLDAEQQEQEEEEEGEEEEDGEGDGESSSSGSQDEDETMHRSKVTVRTTPTDGQTRHQTTQSWSRSHPQTSIAAEPSHTTASLPHLTTSFPGEARIPLGGGIGTLTVRADVQMSGDGSSSSLPQVSHSTAAPQLRDGASFVLSAPRSQSSPFVRGVGLQHSSHAPSSVGRGGRVSEDVRANLFGTSGGRGGIHPSSHIRDGASHQLDDYLSREGIPKLEPAVTSRHSRQSSVSSAASLSDQLRHTAAGGGARVTGSTQTSAPHTHSSPHAATGGLAEGGGSGVFENLESRLKLALESSTLQVHVHVHVLLTYTCSLVTGNTWILMTLRTYVSCMLLRAFGTLIIPANEAL